MSRFIRIAGIAMLGFGVMLSIASILFVWPAELGPVPPEVEMSENRFLPWRGLCFSLMLCAIGLEMVIHCGRSGTLISRKEP